MGCCPWEDAFLSCLWCQGVVRLVWPWVCQFGLGSRSQALCTTTSAQPFTWRTPTLGWHHSSSATSLMERRLASSLPRSFVSWPSLLQTPPPPAACAGSPFHTSLPPTAPPSI